MRRDVEFPSLGELCAAWHYGAGGQELASPGGRPCVVMAGGFAATRDCGFEGYADCLAAAGADVLLFDYRGFGASGGAQRQIIDLSAQRADYHSAIAYARTLEGVDPTRVLIWGHSLSGGHVLQVGAEDHRVGGVVAMAPAADARASIALAVKGNGLRSMARVLAAAVGDAHEARRGRTARLVPVIGPAGATAAFTSDYARHGYTSTAGPTWRNEVAPRIALAISQYRPIRFAAALTCPTLVQVADEDTMASPKAAMQAAWRARADVRRYPCDHMDMLQGGPWFEPAAEHQAHFLRQRFGSATSVGLSAAAA